MRRLTAEHAVADLALGVLHEDATLRPLHEDDKGDDPDRHRQQQDEKHRRHVAGAAEVQGRHQRVRQIGDDAGEDDQRDAVADPARGDLLAEPHQEYGAAGEGHHRHQAEEEARIDHRRLRAGAHAFQSDRDAIGLHRGEQDGKVAGILVELLAAALALFFEGLEGRRHCGQQLDDDRRRDVRHDVESKHRHAAERPAREHVEHAEDAAGIVLEDVLQDAGVDARDRDVGAEPVDDERAEREPDAALKLGRLGKRPEIYAVRELLGG